MGVQLNCVAKGEQSKRSGCKHASVATQCGFSGSVLQYHQ
jgi:hypothetical protein